MIVPDANIFPNNAIYVLSQRFQMIDSDLIVKKRPIHANDGTQCIGVFPSQWLPNLQSYEMQGQDFHSTTLDQYLITVQAYVLDSDEERGLNTHGVLAETLRSILDRDDPLRVALHSLASTLNGVTKVCRRTGVRQQRYVSDELNGSFLYLSTLDFVLETEIQ